VDYRAAEAEQRSKTTMAVRGRANRSGSDPANNPYRPDGSWSSPMGGSFNGQRFSRDSRSLSLDSNMNTKAFPHQQVATTSSSSLAYPQGYYNSPSYAYRHGLNNRHSAEFPRSGSSYLPTTSYDMYGNSASVDMHHSQNQYHHHNQHQNGHHRIPQQISSIYDHHGPTTSPYGSIYSPTSAAPNTQVQAFSYQSKTTIEPTTLIKEEQKEEQTPQPHFKKSPTTEHVGDSPSPPQPTMDTVKGRPNQKVRAALVDNNQYEWF
jgi:hypothetical protein